VPRPLSGFFLAVLETAKMTLTLIVMGLSLLYVVITKKIRRETSESFIVIKKISAEGKTITITVENNGGSAALNVSLSAVLKDRKKKRKVFLLGAASIQPDRKQTFKASDGNLPDLSHITLKVRYRSRKKGQQTEIWSFSESGTPIFRGNR
jgi:hypothetical protein